MKQSVLSAVTSEQRLKALLETELLDSPPEETFDRFTQMATRLLDCPVSFISLVDSDRQFFKSQVGALPKLALDRETPLSHSFCQYVVWLNEPLAVEDAREHPFLWGNSAVTDYGVIAYLGMPLTTRGGDTLGSLCAIDNKPHSWGHDAIQTLRDLAALLMREIDLRQANLKLRATYQQLLGAEQERDRLASMLVHDLRNPLCSMLAALEMAKASEPNLSASHPLSIAQRSGEKLREMIGEILEIKKMEAGPMQLKLAPVNPADVMALALEQLFHSAQSAHFTLSSCVIGKMPAIRADGDKLRRLLINLVANAILHSGGKSVRLTASTSADGAFLIFDVEDDGHGIAKEMRARLFEPYAAASFHQAANGSTGLQMAEKSTGLGLALCKKVAEAHGGGIRMENRAGKGCRFRVEISTGL